MKDGVPAWSVVMVVPKGDRLVLAVNRGFNQRDPAFPGGDSEPGETTPAETAKRELFEETGLQALTLKCIDKWVGPRGQDVYVFIVTRWRGGRVRSSSEGKPFWTQPRHLLVSTATFHEDAGRILKKASTYRPAA